MINLLVILSLYVDDILLIENWPDMISKTKIFLASKFEMKDMGIANYVLGLWISRDRYSKLLYLDQEKYWEKIFKKFKMDNCKPLSTSISKCQHLSKTMCPQNETDIKEMESIPYAQAVGSLMYAIRSIRHDICHAVGLVSRYQSNLGKAHWQAIKRIFRYLQGTKNIKLCFGISDLKISRYTDADLQEMQMTKNLQVVMCSYLVVQLFLSLARNGIVLQNPQWRLRIYHAAQ